MKLSPIQPLLTKLDITKLTTKLIWDFFILYTKDPIAFQLIKAPYTSSSWHPH